MIFDKGKQDHHHDKQDTAIRMMPESFLVPCVVTSSQPAAPGNTDLMSSFIILNYLECHIMGSYIYVPFESGFFHFA